jgi:hypothetical protein
VGGGEGAIPASEWNSCCAVEAGKCCDNKRSTSSRENRGASTEAATGVAELKAASALGSAENGAAATDEIIATGVGTRAVVGAAAAAIAPTVGSASFVAFGSVYVSWNGVGDPNCLNTASMVTTAGAFMPHPSGGQEATEPAAVAEGRTRSCAMPGTAAHLFLATERNTAAKLNEPATLSCNSGLRPTRATASPLPLLDGSSCKAILVRDDATSLDMAACGAAVTTGGIGAALLRTASSLAGSTVVAAADAAAEEAAPALLAVRGGACTRAAPSIAQCGIGGV